MATLHEYFVKDGARDLTMHETWNFSDQNGQMLGQAIARLHFDFHARALYVSFYIPEIPGVECPEATLLNDIPKLLKKRDDVLVKQGGFGEDDEIDGHDLVFTGQVYLYSERPIAPALKNRMIEEARKINHHLTFRSTTYI